MKTIEVFKTMSGALSNIGDLIVSYNKHETNAEDTISYIEQIMFMLTKELENNHDNT